MQKNHFINRKVGAAILVAVSTIGTLFSQGTVQQMEEVQVRADYDREVRGAFLPDVDGTKIHAGKKTSNVDLEQLPEISMDNYRSILRDKTVDGYQEFFDANYK
jgi:hypothetical protein